MASRVVMPKLTDTMEEGVVVQWKKHEGDPISAGDVLAEIETDKAVMDLEAFASGTVRRVLVHEGETVASGTLIAVIGEPEEDISQALAESIGAAPSAVKVERAGTNAATGQPVPVSSPEAQPVTPAAEPEIKASPRAKSVARERGIDLGTVQGSGPEGRITERDVLHATKTTAAKGPAGKDTPLSQMRKAIARTTTQSKAPVPHFYVTSEIDMKEAERFRSEFNHIRPAHISLNDIIVKAAAVALTKHPEINVSFAGETIRQHGSIDIGIAVGLDDGLIAPLIRDSGRKSLAQISNEAKSLVRRAKKRDLSPEEYTGATFTVSNLGMYDVESFIAVLIPPEAAALAVGAVRDVPEVRDGHVQAARRMKVTLSCDHRALDGVQASIFLQELKRLLEHPLELVLAEEQTREA